MVVQRDAGPLRGEGDGHDRGGQSVVAALLAHHGARGNTAHLAQCGHSGMRMKVCMYVCTSWSHIHSLCAAAGGRLSESGLRHLELVLDIPRVWSLRRNDEVGEAVCLLSRGALRRDLILLPLRLSLSLCGSCIFIPDSVGVGSSGALMGMLSSWIVWIVFRW